MGHWEQIGVSNLEHRERLAAMSPWRRWWAKNVDLFVLLGLGAVVLAIAYFWAKLR